MPSRMPAQAAAAAIQMLPNQLLSGVSWITASWVVASVVASVVGFVVASVVTSVGGTVSWGGMGSARNAVMV